MSSQESVTMVETAGFHAVYEKANGFDDFRKPAITVLREEDAELAQAEFLSDLQLGLNSKSKHLSSLYFYDDLGSQLFSRITELDEYYPTNCEADILESSSNEIVRDLVDGAIKEGKQINLIELGAGDGRKTCVLLEALLANDVKFKFFPVDISREAVEMLLHRVHRRFGDRVRVHGVVADNLQGLSWIRENYAAGSNVALFLGSSIGNFPTEAARSFLAGVQKSLNRGDKLLIGFDLLKDPEIMRRAYSDRLGVTAQFNYNLLRRINNEFNANFDLGSFYHVANFNVALGGMESWLISSKDQTVVIPGCGTFEFNSFEGIHTEYSFKYTEKSISELAARSGFKETRLYRDRKNWFADAVWTA
uniref:Histidine-specific methyltransferase SAM-dependent domain-containing protein n=2 Tax=Rhodosorus marinus TaxID=101924 RepID=A0A7S3EMI4_9RHOD|mmetsp:Transcript_6258/g.26507  ORF Transcript_6258/g.26507 Transcript_6258/m.26507 type:complete len:363 (+) Transcript_6258:301-1389(+)